MSKIRIVKSFPYSASQVFSVLSDPHQLVSLLSDSIEVEFESGPEEMRVGAEYRFLMIRFGISQVVRIEVTEFLPGSVFAYRLVEGLFRSWVHRVSIESIDSNSCEVKEEIHYQMAFGILGLLLDDLLVRSDLKNIIEQRLERGLSVIEKTSSQSVEKSS